MIHPVLAGKFYEDEFNTLNKQIEECFVQTTGDVPAKRRDVAIRGILVPHSSYFLAGKCYAWAYRELAEAKFPERVVILVPDNKGIYNAPATSKESWMTPLGAVKVDSGFINELKERYPALIIDNVHEYAIEVQLPFLQYAYRDKFADLKVVPLVVPAIVDYNTLAEAIADIDENVVVVCAANMTRYGIDHGSLPFKWNIEENIRTQDQNALSYLSELDTQGFLQYCKKTRINLIGISALATTLEMMKILFATKGRLLAYYTSSEITKESENIVGFASMVFQ